MQNKNVTTIYLIRHGESIGNANRIFLGHTDLDLSEKGYIQADLTAEALRDVEFDAIYSSDLQRAYNTALPHANLRGLSVVRLPGVRELYCGDWENKKVEDLLLLYGDMYPVDWKLNFGTFRMPNGEAVVEAGRRMFDELQRLSEKHRGETIMVAAHAAIIRSFVCRIMGLTPREYASSLPFPTNASYTVVDFFGGDFSLISYSNDAHLGELRTAIESDVKE